MVGVIATKLEGSHIALFFVVLEYLIKPKIPCSKLRKR